MGVANMERNPPLSQRPRSSMSNGFVDGEQDFAVKPLPPRPSQATLINPTNGMSEDLPELQVAGGEPEGLDPVDNEELEPGSFDLVMPGYQEDGQRCTYELETRSDLLFSRRHLEAIFDDPTQLRRFSSFLYEYRPASIALLKYYLGLLKALRAIDYSNSVMQRLQPPLDADGSHHSEGTGGLPSTYNQELQMQADTAFDHLTREDLPMYITHVWIKTVSVSVKHRIMGTLPHVSEGLAEVFCLTDPSRPDNPIVFTSDEFHRTTQYGVDYVVGRNCRFLQGPNTNPFSIARIREKLEAGLDHYETFLNYRRDGSPFMNLVMLAPLYDSRGVIRYFIGAQVDVSGLAKQCYDLDALKRLVDDDNRDDDQDYESNSKDEFTQLAEIFESRELEIVRQRGGDMHRGRAQSQAPPQREGDAGRPRAGTETRSHHEAGHQSGNWVKPRVVLRDSESPTEENALSNGHNPVQSSTAASLASRHNGRLTGVYEHYLLVRPYPSLRILFTSPSMRVPGILQSPLVDRIGGSARMRDDFVHALVQGQGVTAKVKWLNISHGQTKANMKLKAQRRRQNGGIDQQHHHPLEAHLDFDDDADEHDGESTGRSRWLHCTPLLGANGKVGVWMIVLVDDDSELRLRGGGGGANGSSAAQPQQPLPRPDTSMSSHLRPHASPNVATRGRASNGDTKREPGPDSEQRPQVRPRKSSDTLSSPILSQFPEPSRNGSATELVHQQHSLASGQRAPRPLVPLPRPDQSDPRQPLPQQNLARSKATTTTGLPANFFSLTALSRSSRNKLKDAGRGRSIGAFAAQRSHRPSEQVVATAGTNKEGSTASPSSEKNGASAGDVSHNAESTRHWPLSPNGQTQSGSRYVYIPPAIEERSDRGSRYRDDLETASMQSLGSSYTVRIEE